jgi:peptide/nickel transport system substrate-binding protein
MEFMTGQLAESWEVADDYSSMTVKLRDDVKFQKLDDQYDYYGGRNLTAADVAWSYDRLLGIDGVAQCESEQDWSSKIGMLDSCEVVDDTTITFHFNTTSETAINDFIIAGVCIAGPEWDSLSQDQKSDWHYACGTGPFMVVDYVADSYMTFQKNPDYYMTDDAGNQLPYLDEVTMVVIPDTSNVVAQFISGSLDYIGWGNDVINSSEKQQIRDSLDDSAYVEYTYTTNPCGIFLKQNYEPFQNLNVRIAMQKAIDLETITTQYYGQDVSDLKLFGIYSQTTDWSSFSSWDDELLSEYEYDPDAAKQLLADAGYADGFEFTMVLFAQQDVDLYTLVGEMLKEVGITMNIETVSTPPEMQAVGLDTTDTRCIAGTCCLYALSGGIQNYASFGNNNNGAINDSKLDDLIVTLQNATTIAEQTEAAQAEDLYVAQQHYTIQCGPCETVSSFVSSRIGGLGSERIFKNWNDTTVLTHIWVND